MKQNKLLYVVISLFLVLFLSVPVQAHKREGHDADLEYVLFGSTEYKATHPIDADRIQALEDATYLCVDQFNGNGTKELENLKAASIPGIPNSISEIDYKSNYQHRSETHRGWNLNYEKSNWPMRQQILYNTVETELFSNDKSVFSWLPWKKGKDSEGNSYKEKCTAFCEMLYYIHIIGDHIEADKYTALAYIDPLTQLHDKNNPGVIPDLISCCSILFKDQENSYTYKDFIQEMESLQEDSNRLTSSRGGINTEEKFEEYHQCAEDLLDLMAMYIPKLLKNESFFKDSFAM